ncbi:MAG: GNAT family N-acetyltransferase, partial [Dongiaceae bacterium]
ATLGDPDRQLLIGESDASPVGVLRFDFAGDEAAISVYLTPAGHGRGAGPELLMQGQLWLQHNRPQTARIVAQINAGNDASIAAFAAARYRPQNARYVRDLSRTIAAIH